MKITRDEFARYCSRAWAMGSNNVYKTEFDNNLKEWVMEIENDKKET